jgi:DnaJ-class molecular chaperone
MFYQTKQQPVAVCTVCGAFGYSTRYIGERCGKPDGGRRCMGTRARATDPENWKQCPKCRGTGRYEGYECNVCLNSGWLYVRPTVPAEDEAETP